MIDDLIDGALPTIDHMEIMLDDCALGRLTISLLTAIGVHIARPRRHRFPTGLDEIDKEESIFLTGQSGFDNLDSFVLGFLLVVTL